MSADPDLWAVTVTIPAHINEGDRDDLFVLVADAAHGWEPVDRDGWDIDVSAGPALADEVTALRTKLATAERSKSALVAKVKRLENRLAIARGALPARDVRQGWADAVERADRAEAEVAAVRTKDTPPVCATCGGRRRVFRWKTAARPDSDNDLDVTVPCPDCTEDTNRADT